MSTADRPGTAPGLGWPLSPGHPDGALGWPDPDPSRTDLEEPS